MKFNFKDKNEYIKLIKFGIVGAMNTFIDWAIFFLLTQFTAITPWIAHVISYSCGVISSFLGNKFFTFKSRGTKTGVEMVKFIVLNLLSLGASTLVMILFADMLQWNSYIAKIFSTGASMLINYIGSRFFVFNKTSK